MQPLMQGPPTSFYFAPPPAAGFAHQYMRMPDAFHDQRGMRMPVAMQFAMQAQAPASQMSTNPSAAAGSHAGRAVAVAEHPSYGGLPVTATGTAQAMSRGGAPDEVSPVAPNAMQPGQLTQGQTPIATAEIDPNKSRLNVYTKQQPLADAQIS